MDPRCAAIHPSQHPVPLHPPAASPCVQCSLTTVTNAKAIYTLRRTACSTLTSLSKDPANLQRLGATFLSDLIQELLHSLLTLESSQPELAEEITSVCICIACYSDGLGRGLPDRKLSALLFSECVAAIMLNDNSLNSVRSISVLAGLCDVCKVKNISLPFESLPNDFALHMLSHCVTPRSSSPSHNVLYQNPYSSLIVLLNHVLSTVELSSPREVLQAAVASLPPSRNSDADLMFLTIAYYVVDVIPELILDCNSLLVVLKSAFMSPSRDLRGKATSIIVKMSDKANHLEKLASHALLEYIVESLRISDPSNIQSQLPLLHYSLSALSCFTGSQPSEKWLYSLDVILSVAPYLGANIHELELLVCAALREAPLPLFSRELIEAIVSFAMQMLTHKKDVSYVIRSISSLLERLRPDASHLQALLPVIESTADSTHYMHCVAILISNAGRHFKKLTMRHQEETAVDDLALIGRRLCFVGFEVWAQAHQKSFQKMCSMDAATPVSAVNQLRFVVNVLNAVLDRDFVHIGAYSRQEFCKMVFWCWQTLPPRMMFRYCLTAHNDNLLLESVAEYCTRISSGEETEDCISPKRVPLTENMFLNDLALSLGTPTSLVAYQLLGQALDLNMLHSLCQPELVIQALQERFNNSFSDPNVVSRAFWPERVLTLLSRICAYHSMRFPKLEISQAVLVLTLGEMNLPFSSEMIRHLFHYIVCNRNLSAADVVAWERFADFFKTSFLSPEAASQIVGSILNDDGSLASATHAISEANDPVAIAECLVYLLKRKAMTKTRLEDALQKAEILEKSWLSLRDIESVMNSGLDKLQSTNYRNIRIGTAFLRLLTGACCFSDSRCFRKLSRAVCDVFVCGAIKRDKTTSVDQLLTAALKYLSALIPLLAAENTPTSRYIWQSGVVKSAVQILCTPSWDCTFCNLLVSATCGFLDQMLSGLQERIYRPRREAIVESLHANVPWDRMLCSFPSLLDTSDAHRIARSCHLLRKSVDTESRNSLNFERIGSYRITIALTVAASSVFTGLREAALELLEQTMEENSHLVAWQKCLAVHREVTLVMRQSLHRKA